MAVDALTFDVTTEEDEPRGLAATTTAPPLATTSDRRSVALYTGIAIFDGQQWAALCKELDIASVGSSAQEALQNLKEAVELALEVASENNLSAGSEVPEEELRDFMLSHQRQHAIALTTFRA